MYHNLMKNGVDLVDKMCSLYDASRNFFDLLNLSALNAICIYTANKNYEKVRRRDFLIDLSLAWMKPLALRRLRKKSLPRSLSFKMKDFLGLPQVESQPSLSGSSRAGSVGRCHDCSRARNRSTQKVCKACGKKAGLDHSKIECLSCSQTSE